MEAEKEKPALAAPATAEPVAVDALQRDVQRGLGRCMLRLQQYEKMIKVLAANCEIAGPVAQLQDIQKKRATAVATQTLGGLVTVLTGTYLSPRPADDMTEPEGEPPDNQQIWFRMAARISLEPKDYERVVSGLRDLVGLRNRLAHHFIEMFDLGSMQGCAAADAFLEDSHAQIDLHCTEAQGWLRVLDESRKTMASFMSSDTWSDWLIHGIQPDGTVDWRLSSMVEHLRDAEAALAVDGWAPLGQSVERLRALHPDYTLERYRRSSWRQILNDCGCFEQRCADGAGSRDSRTWFRSKKHVAMVRNVPSASSGQQVVRFARIPGDTALSAT